MVGHYQSCRVVVVSALLACTLGHSVASVGAADTAEIAFTAESSGRLYVMDARTLTVEKRSLGLATIEDLDYSPRNKMLALVGSRGHDSQRYLFLVKWPRAKVERIPYPKDAAPYRPRFDPDGRYLYAVNYGPEIFRYSLTGEQWTRLPVQGAQDLQVQELAVSPSGHLAAISPGDFKGFLLADVAADRFRVTRTVLSDFDSCTSPHWIDDSHIVFLGRKSPGNQFVWLLNVQTGQLSQLTHPPVGARDFLSLSADGHRVVFTATDTVMPAEWTVWRLDLNGAAPIRLLRGRPDGAFLFPTWID